MLNKNKPFSLHLDPDMLRPATAEEKETSLDRMVRIALEISLM